MEGVKDLFRHVEVKSAAYNQCLPHPHNVEEEDKVASGADS